MPQLRLETAPPTTLSMEEFRSAWEPQGWQLLIIGPTATWRQEWGEWEAIREIVQNALDETEGYNWGYSVTPGMPGLWISDQGRGLAVADFLLGPPKPKPPHARGRFGEGMKIGALALLRKGYPVKVDTVGREIWVVFLRVTVDGTADQLAALWRRNGRRYGTHFHIVGYTGSAFPDRFAVNIPDKDILHRGLSPLQEPVRRWNSLIATPPGRVYARDIYMREIKSPFSYNLWGFEIAPDRHAPVSESAMWTDAGRLWATVTKVELLERFLGMVKDPPDEATDESRNVSMSWMGTEPFTKKAYADLMKDNAHAWREAWRRKMSAYAVLRTESRWDAMVKHLGYEPVSASWGTRDALQTVVKTDLALVRESQERLGGAQKVPEERLTPRQLTHLRLARKIADIYRYPPVAGVHAAIIPPATEKYGERTDGLYSRATQEVLIHLTQLESARGTVDTLIHELAHHTSDAEDGEEAHNAAMTRVAARVVEQVAARTFDEELKEAVW